MACELCGEPFSPWSICFDAEVERNTWGGDTHETQFELCNSCLITVLPKHLQELLKHAI